VFIRFIPSVFICVIKSNAKGDQSCHLFRSAELSEFSRSWFTLAQEQAIAIPEDEKPGSGDLQKSEDRTRQRADASPEIARN
jgi:hypothetical protein